MAYSATYNVSIKAPPSKVFEYLADVSRHGEWGSADDRMKIAAEKPGAHPLSARGIRPMLCSMASRTSRR
jgi:uncharacterized protein YndB with AHSA1/START domain